MDIHPFQIQKVQHCPYTLLNDLSRSTFQSSNPIGQYIIHNYMCICAIALTTPRFNPTNQIKA